MVNGYSCQIEPKGRNYVEYLRTALPSEMSRKLMAIARTSRSAVALDGANGS